MKHCIIILILMLTGCSSVPTVGPEVSVDTQYAQDLAKCNTLRGPYNNMAGTGYGAIMGGSLMHALSWGSIWAPGAVLGGILGWFIWEDVSNSASQDDLVAECMREAGHNG